MWKNCGHRVRPETQRKLNVWIWTKDSITDLQPFHTCSCGLNPRDCCCRLCSLMRTKFPTVTWLTHAEDVDHNPAGPEQKGQLFCGCGHTPEFNCRPQIYIILHLAWAKDWISILLYTHHLSVPRPLSLTLTLTLTHTFFLSYPPPIIFMDKRLWTHLLIIELLCFIFCLIALDV